MHSARHSTTCRTWNNPLRSLLAMAWKARAPALRGKQLWQPFSPWPPPQEGKRGHMMLGLPAYMPEHPRAEIHGHEHR